VALKDECILFLGFIYLGERCHPTKRQVRFDVLSVLIVYVGRQETSWKPSFFLLGWLGNVV
jgi:hypothetical protein